MIKIPLVLMECCDKKPKCSLVGRDVVEIPDNLASRSRAKDWEVQMRRGGFRLDT